MPAILNKLINVFGRKVDILEYNILMNSGNGINPLNEIDTMVSEILMKYRTLYIDCMNTPYINDDMKNDMIDSTLKKVLMSMSQYNKKRLLYLYNKEYIEDTILEIIQLKVLDIILEVNGTYKS